MIEDFLPYDKETALAITSTGKRMIRKLLKELNISYDRKQNVTTGYAR